LAAILLLLGPRTASGTTIDPMLWEELVLRADFVGIVECETAGGGVAEYRVVESWKGPNVGLRVRIKTAVNYWEPQFPIALCGERYFITAYKSSAPSTVISTTGGDWVPLWWRNVPADYRLPLFQGREYLKPGEENGQKFEAFRKEAQHLLSLGPEAQEAALLRALMKKDLFGRGPWGDEAPPPIPQGVRQELDGAVSTDELVGALLHLVATDHETWGGSVGAVLRKGGGAITLRRLESLRPEDSPLRPGGKRYEPSPNELVRDIRRRLKPADEDDSSPEPISDAPSKPSPWWEAVTWTTDHPPFRMVWLGAFLSVLLLIVGLADRKMRPIAKRIWISAGLTVYLACLSWMIVAYLLQGPESDPPPTAYFAALVSVLVLSLSAPAIAWACRRSVIVLGGAVVLALGLALLDLTAINPVADPALVNQRAILRGGPSADGFTEAFDELARRDPGAAADFLAGWRKPDHLERRNGGWADGYVLGSRFGWLCGAHRRKHLKTLIRAQDPFIRVAGAVYLCFEDEGEGKAELQNLTELEGDPGAWAALTLAGRGRKEAVPRALEVFRNRNLSRDEETEQSGMDVVPHRNLQKRVLVLLSNSAWRSGVVQPPAVNLGEEGAAFDPLAGWWKAHAEKLEMYDPWRAILDKQKVD
jgi:hypothetical protein